MLSGENRGKRISQSNLIVICRTRSDPQTFTTPIKVIKASWFASQHTRVPNWYISTFSVCPVYEGRINIYTITMQSTIHESCPRNYRVTVCLLRGASGHTERALVTLPLVFGGWWPDLSANRWLFVEVSMLTSVRRGAQSVCHGIKRRTRVAFHSGR